MSLSELRTFLPELVALAGLLAVFISTLAKVPSQLPRQLTLATAALVVLVCLFTWNNPGILFFGTYEVDRVGRLLQCAIAVGVFCIAFISGPLNDIRADVRPEYFLFLLFHLVGLMLLVCSVDIIAIVVALECAAFPLYIMVAMRRERDSQRVQMEAAVKYMMFGIAATGVMLFGMSYLYGLTGTTQLAAIGEALAGREQMPLVIVGITLTLAGMLYKLAVFPFHFWTPDVYEGAANETTALIASLPKIGAVMVMGRFVTLVMPGDNTAAIALILTVFAAASLLYGNLTAIQQTDLKRLLGFSAIAHAGFVMLGFVALTPTGVTAALFTILVYALMIVAAFSVVCRLAPDGQNIRIHELAGLHQRSPLLALTLATAVFGLAGMPPLAGFIGKLALLLAAIQSGHILLPVIAVLSSAIAIFYYLRIIREIYFRPPAATAAPVGLGRAEVLFHALLILAIFALGIFPGLLLDRL